MKKGDDIRYEAFGTGDKYEGRITREGPPGFFDVELALPGIREPYPLKAVRIERLSPR